MFFFKKRHGDSFTNLSAPGLKPSKQFMEFMEMLYLIIGNGEDTLFWKDNWIGEPIFRSLNGDPTLVDDSTRVCDFITRNFDWDVSKLFALLPMEIAVQIMGYPLPKFSPMQDKNVWKYSQWTSLGISNFPGCPACGHHVENLIHILRDCFVAKNFWNGCIERSQRGSFYTMDMLPEESHINLAGALVITSERLLMERVKVIRALQEIVACLEMKVVHGLWVLLLIWGLVQAWQRNLLPFGRLLTPIRSLIKDIRSLKARNWMLTFQHIQREGNFCADILSKLGCSLEDDLVIFSSPPAEVFPLLETDTIGVSFPKGFSLQ
ncbi:hypothetical protein F3Y22_tig00000218pilonHSYRG00197 [Hibiscus syriacus]|uniref:Reverse transcriptase zinc-binding domain-containing protein n=1 Tax=Hibiscus syriacus TaxID=106335 RepID=A0A6A3D2N1_HIBSY|nr:hypothetical protein F3Y22_tig00000218pilonHSYRG00197 [Hibiscus syriacus]